VVGAVAHIDESGSTEHTMKEFNVIHCTGVTKKPDLKRIEAGLKTGRYGCSKIYLGYAHQYAYDPLYRPVYRLAEKYGVPVVFHTGDTYTSDGKLKYAHPLTIDEVAVDFRKVNF